MLIAGNIINNKKKENMKKILCLLTILPALLFTSCTKDEDNTKDEIDNIYLSLSDINGVWESDSNNLYFISFTKGGRYSFCFNNQLMGAGNYKLEKNIISLENDYLYTTDVIEVAIVNKKLALKGNLYLFKQQDKKNINLIFDKSTEKTPPSVVGEKRDGGLSGLNAYYENTDVRMVYQTDYIAKYEYDGYSRKNGAYKMIKEHTWFYVYRPPYTYTQITSEKGEVIIYDFDNKFAGERLEDNVVTQ